MAIKAKKKGKEMFLSGLGDLEGIQRVCANIDGKKTCMKTPAMAYGGKRNTKAGSYARKAFSVTKVKKDGTTVTYNVPATTINRKASTKRSDAEATWNAKYGSNASKAGLRVSKSGRLTKRGGPSPMAVCGLKASSKAKAKAFYNRLADKGIRCEAGDMKKYKAKFGKGE